MLWRCLKFLLLYFWFVFNCSGILLFIRCNLLWVLFFFLHVLILSSCTIFSLQWLLALCSVIMLTYFLYTVMVICSSQGAFVMVCNVLLDCFKYYMLSCTKNRFFPLNMRCWNWSVSNMSVHLLCHKILHVVRSISRM